MTYFIVEQTDRGTTFQPGEYETREEAEAALAELLDQEQDPKARAALSDVLHIVNS